MEMVVGTLVVFTLLRVVRVMELPPQTHFWYVSVGLPVTDRA